MGETIGKIGPLKYKKNDQQQRTNTAKKVIICRMIRVDTICKCIYRSFLRARIRHELWFAKRINTQEFLAKEEVTLSKFCSNNSQKWSES